MLTCTANTFYKYSALSLEGDSAFLVRFLVIDCMVILPDSYDIAIKNKRMFRVGTSFVVVG